MTGLTYTKLGWIPWKKSFGTTLTMKQLELNSRRKNDELIAVHDGSRYDDDHGHTGLLLSSAVGSKIVPRFDHGSWRS